MKWISGLFIGFLFAATGVAWGDSCSVTTTPANLGYYDSIGQTASDAVVDISINCSPGVTYTLKSDPGQNSQAVFQRKMLSSGWGSLLNYNLYVDSAYTEVWGDGTGTTFVISGTGTGVPALYRVYVRIPGGQRVRAGIYNDLINVIVEW